MAEYILQDEAVGDLLAIGRYTVETWGLAQAERYLSALEDHFTAIARRAVLVRRVDDHHPDLFMSRCQHHYVFFAREGEARPIILAVFHEKMDLITRLADRLEAGGNEP